MDQSQLNEAATTLSEKGATKPCPRCGTNNFSIVGETEISVKQAPPRRGLLGGLAAIGHNIKITMPIIIITCDNCGYVSQHAKASLVKEKEELGLGLLGRNMR